MYIIPIATKKETYSNVRILKLSILSKLFTFGSYAATYLF